MKTDDLLIGFIGQGYIGKNYALDFERRGFAIVRYSKEPAFLHNKEEIAKCDIVFIAVPTPTTEKGFDDSMVRDALKCVGKGSTVIIKSTILPGTVESLQLAYPDLFIMHSPEFLRELTAEYDAAHPERNIIGIPVQNEEFKKRAERVLAILPKATYSIICSSRDAELVKYAGNCFLYTKVVYMNMLYDLAEKMGCNWQVIAEALSHDSRIGKSHLNPVHKSGTGNQAGRGAGGNCFIKDFSTFKKLYSEEVGDEKGEELLKALEDKNINLLLQSNKDLALLKGVYGDKLDEHVTELTN